jgi:hypothetical protein
MVQRRDGTSTNVQAVWKVFVGETENISGCLRGFTVRQIAAVVL